MSGMNIFGGTDYDRGLQSFFIHQEDHIKFYLWKYKNQIFSF